MTRRQLFVLLAVPTLVASFGAGALFTNATGESVAADPNCRPGPGCRGPAAAAGGECLVPTADATILATAAACGPGPCCAPSCCVGTAAAEAR